MSENNIQKELAPEEKEQLITLLRDRFNKNPARHTGIKWDNVQQKLEADPGKLRSLYVMERTGGEPDVVSYDKATGQFVFYDCSAETPKDRRNLCYDREALDSRKEFKPSDSAIDMATAMGIELLSEEEYVYLQTLGEFDSKTSSWLKTPAGIRKHGGAIFGDRRFGRVFIYHNGASSYYVVRGFRGSLKV
jgi:hypothetical protein